MGSSINNSQGWTHILKCIRNRTGTSQGRPALSSRTLGVFAGEGEEEGIPPVKKKVNNVWLYPPLGKLTGSCYLLHIFS